VRILHAEPRFIPRVILDLDARAILGVEAASQHTVVHDDATDVTISNAELIGVGIFFAAQNMD
jgi:hypothetical protein